MKVDLKKLLTSNGFGKNLKTAAQALLDDNIKTIKIGGDQLDQAAIYTGKNLVNMSAANNVGNLLNMML